MVDKIELAQYEIYRHRLFNVLEEGRLAMKMVSGSSVVVEGGETMCSMHNTDGTTVLVASGILLHAIGAQDFIFKAIEWYEQDPGINEGDQFFFNDPYIGGQHLADMVIIAPIFYRGKRIAWVGSIMHTPETGGIQPGGQGVAATEIFHEGIRILGLKIVEGGKFRPDVFNSIVQQVRDPHLVGLDIKAKVAANNVCRSRYLEMIEQFGIGFIEAASRKIVTDAEQMAREKLRGLPDGVWRSRLYLDTTGTVQRPIKIMCTMTKSGDEICFDFTGSSPQVEGSINSTFSATRGSLFVVLCSQLFWDVPWNGGMMAATKLIAPEGTVVNCRFPVATANAVHSVGCLIQETAHECIAKMLFAGGMIEDVNSAWRGSGSGGPVFGGINQFGQRCAGILMDSFGCGLGATPYRDGVDTGGHMINPSSRISDIEKTEMNLPFLSLGRRNAMDTGGYGKYHGGMAPQNIYMIYGTDHFVAGLIGSGRRTPANFGMFGGYPGAVHESRYSLDSELPKWFERSAIPGTFEEIAEMGGTVIDPPNSFGPIPVKQYDVLIIRQGAGGGYGDPLDRDPERVAYDVRNFSVSLETARKAYGVVLDPNALEVDRILTEKAREEIRNERLRNGKPVNIKGCE